MIKMIRKMNKKNEKRGDKELGSINIKEIVSRGGMRARS